MAQYVLLRFESKTRKRTCLMQKFCGLIAALTLSVSGLASAEVIIADPSIFAARTDITQAYEGASLFSASINKNGVVSYDSLYAADCNGCKPAVSGQRVFGHYYSGTDSYLTTFSDEMFFASALKKGSAFETYGSVVLADFDKETNFFQVVGSQGHANTDFFIDIWDDAKNWLGRCSTGSTTGGCSSRVLSVPPNGTPNQGYLPLWEISFASDIANIGFITVAGSDGPGYVRSLAYSVPEPAPMALLALGIAGLLIGRRTAKAQSTAV